MERHNADAARTVVAESGEFDYVGHPLPYYRDHFGFYATKGSLIVHFNELGDLPKRCTARPRVTSAWILGDGRHEVIAYYGDTRLVFTPETRGGLSWLETTLRGKEEGGT